MSQLKPYSSFTDDIPASKISDLLLYWHWNDVTSGDTTWTDRVSGTVLTFNKPILKDSEGLYTGQTATITCPSLPIPGQNAILVNICKMATASPTSGGVVTLGSTVEGSGPGISTNGAASQASAGEIAAATFAATPSGNGKNACRATALVSSGNTALCVLAHDDGATTTIANDSTNASVALTEFATLPLGTTAITIGSVSAASDDGRRGRIIALLSPSTAITLNDLQLACVEMARTKQLWAGFFRA